MAAVAGELLGSYRLVRPLGRGGMGEVWLAEHVEIKSQVAIKLVLAAADDDAAAGRFLREAKATARIRHPGIVAVSDYGTRPGGGAYLVMELLDGRSLAERLQHGPLPATHAIQIAIQISDALVAAHAAGIVHRDLKPGNVFLVDDAAALGGARVKLLDFGVAKTGKITGELGTTATGALIGTPLYMAPEQCTSQRGPVDERADLYALGALIYELTTGRPPFLGPTLGDLIEQHLTSTPQPLRSHVPTLPAKLDVLVMRLLAKQREERPATAAEVSAALAAITSGADERVGATLTTFDGQTLDPHVSGSRPTTEPPADAKPGVAVTVARTRRPRWPLVAFAGLGAVGIATLAWFLVQRRHTTGTTAAPDPARLDPVVLHQACADRDGAACLEEALFELRTSAKPDQRRLFAHFTEACDHDNADGCAFVANAYDNGSGIDASPAKALTFAQKACMRGSGFGCALAGELASRVIDDDGASMKQAFSSFEQSCKLDYPEGCYEQAVALAIGRGVPRDETTASKLQAKARELGDRGCREDHADACRTIGLVDYRGKLGARADPASAEKMLVHACELGNANACNDAGQLLLLGLGGHTDAPRGYAIVVRGCDLGSMDSCMSQAIALANGLGTKVDPAAGFALAKQTCEQSDRNCTVRAIFHSMGVGTPQDPKLAALFYERACHAGDAGACVSAADAGIPGTERPLAQRERLLTEACRLGNGGGCDKLGRQARTARDFKRAITYFEQACDLSDRSLGCAEVAMMMIDGEGVVADPTRGRAILESDCNNGGPVPCFTLGERLRDGKGLPKEPDHALRALEHSCELTWTRGCLAAADMLDHADTGVAQNGAHATELRARACKSEPRVCEKSAGSGSGPGSDSGSRSGSGSGGAR